MSVGGKLGFLALTLGALAGAGYASVNGMLPALPGQFDQTLKNATVALADKAGVRLSTKPSATPAGSASAAVGSTPARPPVAIKTGRAERKTMPVRFETIGTVQTLASVAVRARVDSQILSVEFTDGASVKAGDVLFRLDARQIEALIKQAEGNAQRARAGLELGEADVRRKEQLATKEATSQALLDNARSVVAVARAQIKADEAALENLKVQRTFYDIVAPISGRIGVATLKAGSLTKPGEAGQILATINQITPIYVAFPVPQRLLPDLREAVLDGSAIVKATPQGIKRGADGKIALLDNTVDAATGTIVARAIFENANEVLWPGGLANVRIDLRQVPDTVVVPREAVMNGQQGNYLYIVENQTAQLRIVTIDRTIEGSTVVTSGLNGDEVVVVDGQSQLVNGAKVIVPGQQGPTPPTPGAPAAGSPPNQG